ncbi:MAG TPA: TerC family protein [Methylomirabilota bacterium]|jgi:YjbE family integral membrane protein|nr:TerC family protein [Methylomirabilota bacterium]
MLSGLFEPEFLARLWSIVMIDLLLAGDNALVIALAVRSLPRRQQFLGRLFGTAGAVVLRVVLIAIATALLKVPLLQVAGGALLIWIAVKLVSEPGTDDKRVREGSSLRSAIGIIIVADLVMSLDNVLGVAGAARGDMRLVVFGIALSIPIVVWGSGLLARLMTRFAWVIWLGGGILGYVAGEMLLADEAVARWIGPLTTLLVHGLPPILGAVIVAVGWWHARTRRASFAGLAE